MGLFDTLARLDKAQEEEIIRVAGESIKHEVEKEYCVWVKPTQAGWDWLHAQSAKMFMDILMPIEGGRRRIRIKEDGTAQLTLKRKFQDGKVEENSDIGISSALSFYKDGYLAHLVKRIHLEPGELADKGAKHWDIDIFSITTGHPAIEVSADFNDLITEMRSSTSVGDWVKVELEVERYEITDVLSVIPFEFDGHIPATPKDPEDQEYLRDYWDSVTRM
ncbi:hypothetical protein LAA31_002598 [Salmonella enterica subsp. enterica serovar Enteritidis]|nr:hypothetical protein [Salmonella enterica subsp. enterica serovar Enteritidis]